MSKNTNLNRGFTLVELLIVIVVIAILAAISIVAYNGIQNRARNTTNAETASQLKTKIEAWNSIKGAYPTPTVVTGGQVDTTAPEARIETSLLDKVSVTATTTVPAQPTVDAARPVTATPCGSTTAPTGYVIVWGTNPADANARTTIGICS